MPVNDYTRFQSDQWQVIVTLSQPAGVHELVGPTQPIEKAEESLEVIRAGVHQGTAINLPWLAVSGADVLSAHITRR